MTKAQYQAQRMRSSYDNYLSKRQAWKERGYGSERKLTFKEYKEAFGILKLKGEKNIAATIAKEQLYISPSASQKLQKLAEPIDPGISIDKIRKQGIKAIKIEQGEHKSKAQALYMTLLNKYSRRNANAAFGY